jgi:hypothetical protein
LNEHKLEEIAKKLLHQNDLKIKFENALNLSLKKKAMNDEDVEQEADKDAFTGVAIVVFNTQTA